MLKCSLLIEEKLHKSYQRTPVVAHHSLRFPFMLFWDGISLGNVNLLRNSSFLVQCCFHYLSDQSSCLTIGYISSNLVNEITKKTWSDIYDHNYQSWSERYHQKDTRSCQQDFMKWGLKFGFLCLQQFKEQH